MAEDSGLLLRVFTHPACSGCPKVVDKAWTLSQEHPILDLRTVNLVNEDGLAEARAEGIQTIPSVILSADGAEIERWVGSPESGALEAAVDELAKMARAL